MTVLTIDPEFAQLIPAPSVEERAQLEASLLEEGCRDALVAWNGVLLDGHNRYALCQKHDIPFSVVERQFDSREDALVWICTNQMARRNLTAFARSELALRMKDALATKAEYRKRQTQFGNTVVQNSAPPETGKTRDVIAAEAGVSHDTIRKVELITEFAPEPVKEQARNGELSVHRAYQLTECFNQLPAEHRDDAARLCGDDVAKAETLVRLYKSSGSPETNGTYDEIMATGGFHFGDDMEHWCNFLQRTAREIDIALRSVAKHHAREAQEARREERRQRAQHLPQGVFNVIYADPAWEYDNTGVHGAAADHYDTMPTEDIYALPQRLNLCVDDNAILFLWTTNAFLSEGLECIRRWGFTYKTNAVWVKTDLVKPGSGWYLRGRHELLLIATRGSFTPLDEHISPPIGSVIVAPLQEHSRKPDEVYDVIERLYPGCSYLELFARRAREGWQAWGNEVHE